MAAWGDLGPRNGVSFTAMQTSGIPLKPGYSHITSPAIMTKNEVIERYNVKLTNPYLSAKSGNSIVVKRDLETGVPATAELYIYIYLNPSGQADWVASIFPVIPEVVTITEGSAQGYYNPEDCGVGLPDEFMDMYKTLSPGAAIGFSIPPNTGAAFYLPDSGFSPAVKNYQMNNYIKINDTVKYYGDTIMIGATLVTVYFQTNCIIS